MANEKRCDWSVYTPLLGDLTESGVPSPTLKRCEMRGATGKGWSHVKVVMDMNIGGSYGTQTTKVLDICPEHSRALADATSAAAVRK